MKFDLEPYKLITHFIDADSFNKNKEIFEIIGEWDAVPSIDLCVLVIEKFFNKKVIHYEILDKENLLFKFKDNTFIELLLRKAKYLS